MKYLIKSSILSSWNTRPLRHVISRWGKRGLKHLLAIILWSNFVYGKTIMLWVNDLDFVVDIKGKVSIVRGLQFPNIIFFFKGKT